MFTLYDVNVKIKLKLYVFQINLKTLLHNITKPCKLLHMPTKELIETKQLNGKSPADLSIQERTEDKNISGKGTGIHSIWFNSLTESGIAEYWSEARDVDLREFVRQEGNDILVGAKASLIKKFQSMNWILEGRTSRTKRVPQLGTIEFYQPIIANSEFGEGWSVLLSKTLDDFYNQDKGASWELLGGGDPTGPIEGPVLGIAHLDAGLIRLTGDLTYPALFLNTKDDTEHKIHHSRLVRFVDMPNPDEDYLVGFCAVSRVISSSNILLQISTYKKEKLSDLPEAGFLILNNIMQHQWEDNTAKFQRERRKLGQQYWTNVMTFFGIDPAQPATADLVSFSNLPDAFNELESTNIYINILALAFGVDAREFWPLTGGILGTATESQIQHQKARGKGVGQVLGLIERAINWRVLPSTVTFRFDFRDDEEDALKADINQNKTKTIMSMWQPGKVGDVEHEPPVSSDEIRQMLAEQTEYFKKDWLKKEEVSDESIVSDIDRQGDL